MTDSLEQTDESRKLETAVAGLLASESELTPERIREVIGHFRAIPWFNIDDSMAEQLARKFEARHAVTMSIGSVLTERGYEPWLDAARVKIDPYYWGRYR